MMVLLQIACLLTIGAALVMRARLEAEPAALLRRLFFLALAAWAAEDTCIRAYGLLEYSPSWWLSIDRVPLVVVLAWPLAIQSARDLGTCLWAGRDRPSARRVALTALGLAFADAALIEPLGAQSGLWRWAAPGALGAAPIGMVGRACFAAIAVLVIERAAWRHRRWEEALVVVAGPAGAHLAVIAAWWGALRWVPVALPGWAAAVLAWLVSVPLSAHALQARANRRVPPLLLWARAPAALVGLVLLGLGGPERGALAVYALAFVPPYLTLFSRGPLVRLRRRWEARS